MQRTLPAQTLARAHTAAIITKEFFLVTQVSSNLSTPPSCRLFKIKDEMASREVAMLVSPVQLVPPGPPPQLFSYESKRSGRRQYGLFYAPIVASPGQKCPTLLFVYGGPQVSIAAMASSSSSIIIACIVVFATVTRRFSW